MGRPKGAAKGKYDDLDLEFKTLIENASDEDIKKKVSEVALSEHENKAAQKADLDLEEKKAACKFANEGYAENTKQNKLRISYAHYILNGRGKI
jgi:hypothetical protein